MKIIARTIFCFAALFVAASSFAFAKKVKKEFPKYSTHAEIPDTKSEIVTEPQQMQDITAKQVVRLMGNGINLGNTLEAVGEKKPDDIPTVYEQQWGQPVTTRQLMKAYKAAGFDCVRIPVAWVTNATHYKEGNYVINKGFLDRVETVVNYALDEGLYVVLNDHWDGGWWGMFGSADKQTRADANELYVALWTQIANRFKNYSEKLIFEGANEEIGPRFNDIYACADSGTLSEKQWFSEANRVNQLFVDTVRKTGGNNAKRFLLIAGINTDIERTCDARFLMPKDSVQDKLILSVHYYTPWNFCGEASVSVWGTKNDYEEQNRLLKMLEKFTDAGYGVIIGEWAVFPEKDGSKKQSALEFFENFLDNCDAYNYCPILWDCSTFFIRKDFSFNDKEIADFFKGRSFSAQSEIHPSTLARNARERTENRAKSAPQSFAQNEFVGSTDRAVAWIMFASQDWGFSYSVGDVYNPDNKSGGIEVCDVEVTGPGTYTVSLDFKNTWKGFAKSFAFSALAIYNGEILFPECVIDIKSFKVNDKETKFSAKPYTTSDDGKCTRVNIYNEWVTKLPSKIRTADNNAKGASAIIVNQKDAALQEIKKIEITFELITK